MPSSWVWTTIGDIAESNIGLTYKPSDICDDGVPVYRSNNIQNRRIDKTELVRVNAKILDKQYLSVGDLLICARNGSRRLVGKCALIENLSEPSAFGAFMAVCRSAYNPWIYLLLNTGYFNRYLDDSNSTAINQVTQSMLLAFRVPFPPKKEQDRIIYEISKWFDLIDTIEKSKEELQVIISTTKSKILDLAIHGKLVPQDPTDEPASELLKRINPKAEIISDNGHYQKLPNGWSITELCNISTILNGYAFKSSEYISSNGIRIIRIANVQDGYIEDKLPQYYPKSKSSDIGHFLLEYNDLLMSLTGNVGRVGILPNSLLPAALNQRVACIRENRSIVNKYYLFYLFQSNKFCSECIKSAKGVAQLNISTEWLKSYTILLPPLAEQKRIVAKIEEIFAQLDAIETAL